MTVQNSKGDIFYEEKWINTASLATEQDLTFVFTPTEPGTYYFKAKSDELTIVSSDFNVSDNLQEIISPLESQLILQGTTVTI